MLAFEERLNVDETGHKENGRRLWTWCFRAYLYAVYKNQVYGQLLLDDLRRLFAVIHRRETGAAPPPF